MSKRAWNCLKIEYASKETLPTMTLVLNKDVMRIVKEQDVVPFRNRVKEYAVKMGMTILNQTKLITAASELVRNMLKYANGGKVILEIISQNGKTGVRLVFEDKG